MEQISESTIRKIIKEELARLAHSNLKGMPDYGSINRDHDNSYLRKDTNLLLNDFYMELKEISTPQTPGAYKGRIYVKDDSGSTKLCLKDNAGAETVFGTSTVANLTDLGDIGDVVYTAGYVLQGDGVNLDVSQLAHTNLSSIGTNTHAQIDTHVGSTTNPHSVSAAQTGAATTSTKLDDFATPDDNTDLNATTTYHGLLMKLDNNASNFLNGQGTWAAPAGVTDHGALSGLGDDDHTQYIKDSEFGADSQVLVGTGVGTFAAESGTTLRTSLGLGTGNTPTFAGLTLNGTLTGANAETIANSTDGRWDIAGNLWLNNASSTITFNEAIDVILTGASGQLNLTGDLDVSGTIAVGSTGVVSSYILANLETLSTEYQNTKYGIYAAPTYNPSSPHTGGKKMVGIGGYNILRNATNWNEVGLEAFGLQFLGSYCSESAGGTGLSVYGVHVGGAGGFKVSPQTFTAANVYGLHVTPCVNYWNTTFAVTNEYTAYFVAPTLGTNKYQLVAAGSGTGTGIWFSSAAATTPRLWASSATIGNLGYGTTAAVSFGDGTSAKVGFLGTAPIAKPTVSGSKGGNAALTSLCTALANLGLITNSTS